MSLYRRLQSSPVFSRFLKFGFLGLFTTAFGIGIYYILLKMLHMNVYLSYPIQFTLAVSVSYLLNSYFNYKEKPYFKGWFVFLYSYGVSGALGFGLLIILKLILIDWDDFIIILILAAIKAALTFFVIERVMFSKEKE